MESRTLRRTILQGASILAICTAVSATAQTVQINGGAPLPNPLTTLTTDSYAGGVTSTGVDPVATVDNLVNGEVVQVSEDATPASLTNAGTVTVTASAIGTGNAAASVGNPTPDVPATGAYQSAITQKHLLGDVEGATWDALATLTNTGTVRVRAIASSSDGNATATVYGGISQVASVETKGRTATAVMSNSGTAEVSASASGAADVTAAVGTGGETGSPAIRQFVFSAKSPDVTTTGSGSILNSGTVSVTATATPLVAGASSANAKITGGIVQQVQATGRGNSNLTALVNSSNTMTFNATAGVGPGTALTATAFATEVLTQRVQANGGGVEGDPVTGWNDVATVTLTNSGTINLTTNATAVESATSLLGVKATPADFGQYADLYPNTYGPNGVGVGTNNSYQLFGGASPIISEHGVISQRGQANGWGDDVTRLTFTNAANGNINIGASATATNPEGNARASNVAAGLIVQKTQANGSGNDTSTAELTNAGRIGVTAGATSTATGGDAAAVSAVSNAIVQVAEVTGPTKYAIDGGEGGEPTFGFYTNIGTLTFTNGATGVVDLRSSATANATGGGAEAHTYVDAGLLQTAQVDGGTPQASFDNRGNFTVRSTSIATGTGAFASAGTAGLALDAGFPVDEGRLPSAHDVVGVNQVLIGKTTDARFANSGTVGVTASATANGGTEGSGALASAIGYRVTGEPVGVTVSNSGTVSVSATANTTADVEAVRLANAQATGMGFYANYVPLPELPDIVHGGGSETGGGQGGHPPGDTEEEPSIPTYALTGTVLNTGTIAVVASSTGNASIPDVELALPGSIVPGQTLNVGSTAVGVDFVSASNNVTMENRGTIQVSAMTDGAPAQAYGIRVLDYENSFDVQAGEGDVFTLFNNGGTIIARKSTNLGANWDHGLAIDTSLAPNRVNIRFGGASAVYGDIDISADDAITIESGETALDGFINPDEVLEGSLTINNGATLYLMDPRNSNPNYDGPAGGYLDSFTMQSGSTLALQLPTSSTSNVMSASSLSAPGIGTQSMHTPYTQIITNTAALNGTLELRVSSPNGLYDDRYEYQNIIDANTLTGRFTSVVTSTRSALLSPSVVYDTANNVDLTIVRVPFGAVPGLTFNQGAAGDGIEAVYTPTQTGPYGTLLANLFLQTPATYPSALDQISGDQYAGFTQNLRNGSLQVNSLVSDQLDCAISKDKVDACRDPDGGLRLWALGGFNDSRVDGDGNGSGYEADSWFGLMGLDYTVGNFTVGAFGGYRKSQADFTRNGGRIEADGYQIGLLAGYDVGTFYLRGHGSYASLDGNSTRNVGIGTTAGMISGKPEYRVWSGYGELGARIGLGKTWLTPFVAVDYTSVKLKSFTETGVPGANLQFAEQTEDQTTLLAGLKWAADLGGVIPELKVAYRHDSGNPFFASTARFADAPGDSWFTVRSPATDNDSVMAGFSIAGVLGEKVTGRIGYQGRFSDGLRDNAFYGSLVVRFGGNEAPPPPPAQPLPPPPPAPAPVAEAPPPPPPVCSKGPYIVFFDWDKADVTPEAAAVLDSAVVAYGNCESVPIMLAGYADRSGAETYNVALSERRNASVRTYLGQRGVPDTAISSQAFGESNNRVPTADGVRELQNRRVEITYGPGSGM